LLERRGEKKRRRRSSHLRGGTLELQQHHGAGTLHDVEVEQQRLVAVETTERSEDEDAGGGARKILGRGARHKPWYK